ncbi:MAG: D-glycero-beta-D-manno-heptose 1-phosphate adenylyltransferase [Terriglobia bacterium]
MGVEKILTLERAYEVVADLKRRGKRVVFTNGCFDLLHPGHTRYLAAARKLGDVLIVAVNSDRSVRALKGSERAIQPEIERAEILAALKAVDYVTIFDDLTPQTVIARMLPQVLVKGGDWKLDAIVGRAEVEAAGGLVVSIPVVEGYSTSSMIQAALRTVTSDEPKDRFQVSGQSAPPVRNQSPCITDNGLLTTDDGRRTTDD